jgi:putative aldouronate transport system substrate-binding protein
MIASGKYPDVLELRGNEWIDAGALIPLEDLIEQYGPRIKEHYKDTWERMKAPDGHIYYLVNFGVFHGIDHNPTYDQGAFWVQKDVLRDAGYPQIKTVDQFFDMIENYYRKNPTINGQPAIPFTVLTDDWRAFEMWNTPNLLSGHSDDGNGIVNPVTYEYKCFFTQDVSKRWFQKLNGYNARGLVDRTGFTDNYDQYLAKIASGRLLGQFVSGWQFIYSADMANRERGENHRSMVPLPVVFDETIRPRYRVHTPPNLMRGGGISVSAKDPVRIIRFWNDLLDEEIQRTVYWGFEGKDWQWDENHIPYRTEAQRANLNNQNWQEQNRALLFGDVFPKIQGSFSDGFPADLGHFYPEREASLLPEDKEIFEAYGVASYSELMDKDPPPNYPWFPAWNVPTPPDGSEAQIALRRCEQTMRQRLPQMILAPPADFERLWAAYVDEMNANRLDQYERHMQEQLMLRLKAWGVID